MFSNNCKMKQNKLIEKLISQLLNIEIMDLHTRLVHTKKHQKNKKQFRKDNRKKYYLTILGLLHYKTHIYYKPTQNKIREKIKQ